MDDRREPKPRVPSGPEGSRSTALALMEPRRVAVAVVSELGLPKNSGESSADERRLGGPIGAGRDSSGVFLIILILSESESRETCCFCC